MCEFVFRLPSSHFLFIVDIIMDTQYTVLTLCTIIYNAGLYLSLHYWLTVFVPPFRNRVGHVLKLVNSMDKLIDACESSPNMRMPKVIALNKQLKKELNPAKVIKDQRQNCKKKNNSNSNNIIISFSPSL